MWNSCTNVFSNTHAWEQQEGNKTKKQKESSKAGTEKISPDGLTVARTYCPPQGSLRPESKNELPN